MFLIELAHDFHLNREGSKISYLPLSQPNSCASATLCRASKLESGHLLSHLHARRQHLHPQRDWVQPKFQWAIGSL